uniref:Prenyltransferase alpha-alpha toroid domain-containing protein n=1 Tax=Peronospora matthiolae TaxID=2874970 RepID=A0AAV1VBK1_9STRA
MASSTLFDRELHAQYFLTNLRSLPAPYSSQDSQRVVLAFFCVHGLALLKQLERVDRHQRRLSRRTLHRERLHPNGSTYDTSNVASTFAALCILRTLGDDLHRVDKPAIVRALASLQDDTTGCFSSVNEGSEQDMRFVYCACAISYILDDWSGIDVPAMVRFINSCLSYDGGIGLCAGAESHGGAVFTAIASLTLSGQLTQLKCKQSELVQWLVFRQQDCGGFQGRLNKVPDSCYAFWNGATLALLQEHALVDSPSCRQFIYACQFSFGGLCKYPESVPDVMHSYLSLAWLSIAAHTDPDRTRGDEEEGEYPPLAPLDTKLQVPFFPPLLSESTEPEPRQERTTTQQQ